MYAVNNATTTPPASPANSSQQSGPHLPTLPPLKILKGQRAIVTGASSGIGEGVALALGEAGADVVVNYARHREPAEQVAQKIRDSGAKALVFDADVSKES